MASIISGISSLPQHLILLKEQPGKYKLKCCPYPDCGAVGLWGHGCRYRKADREHNAQSLNPIPIVRLYCPACGHTCSVLPECIPPFRWYLWLLQQMAIKLFFSGISFNKISQQLSPSRWTLSRWINRLTSQFEQHAFHLKSKWPWLGYHISVNRFWSALFEKMDLSNVMLFLNNQGIAVP